MNVSQPTKLNVNPNRAIRHLPERRFDEGDALIVIGSAGLIVCAALFLLARFG